MLNVTFAHLHLRVLAHEEIGEQTEELERGRNEYYSKFVVNEN